MSATSAARYRAARDNRHAYHAAESRAAREIAPLPKVANPPRRRAARKSFQAFCELYQAGVYMLPWSDDHLRMIARIESAVRKGTLCAFAMPRGSGKTSLCESAVLWATLHGFVPFSVLLGADHAAAERNLQSIHSQLIMNSDIIEDWPEVCEPLARLEGIHQRKFLYNGRPITYQLTHTRIVLPNIAGAVACGAVIQTAGLTSHIRGMKYQHPSGRAIRPALVMVDDPQTDESARSPAQCEARASILAGAVLGLAGPGKRIAGVMPCTVISPGDLADTILDRSKHPDWHGERTRMVYSFPSSPRWEEYAAIRADSLRAGGGGAEATEYYRQHREEMDEGAAVAWPARYHEGELSAIQHAINLKLRNEAAFWSEYQNEPLPDPVFAAELTADQVAARVTGRPRGVAPLETMLVTGFVDVQAAALYWVLVAWAADFTGSVIDYGTYPDQGRHYFTLRDVRRTLARVAPGTGLEGAIHAGLETLIAQLATRPIARDDGAELRIDRLLVDANWSVSTEIVYSVCRASPHAAVVMPSHGRYVGASSRPMSEWHRKPGDRRGLNWTVPAVEKRAIRHLVFDTNYWKSFVHARLATAPGDRGALRLFGDRSEVHRMFAEHLTAEYRVATTGRGRTVEEWKARPDGGDNHWLDGLVGAAVAASLQGAALAGQAAPRPARRRYTGADANKAAAASAPRR